VRRRRQGLSLRARLLAVGVTGVALSLALGSFVLYAVLTVTLNRTVDDSAFASAHVVAAMVDNNTVPDPLPVSGSQVVQIVDSSGAVISASVSADRLTPLLRPAELTKALAGERISVPAARAGLAGTLHAIAVRAGPSSAPRSVIVAVPVTDIEQSQRVLRNTFLTSRRTAGRRPVTVAEPAASRTRTSPLTSSCVVSTNASSAERSGENQRPS